MKLLILIIAIFFLTVAAQVQVTPKEERIVGEKPIIKESKTSIRHVKW